MGGINGLLLFVLYALPTAAGCYYAGLKARWPDRFLPLGWVAFVASFVLGTLFAGLPFVGLVSNQLFLFSIGWFARYVTTVIQRRRAFR